MKCFVLFRLRPGVTPEAYEEWFRATNVPAIRTMTTVSDYRVWRVAGVMDGEPTFEVLEEMTIEDRDAFERELEALDAVKAMLDGWYERVADQVVVYGEEVPKE